MMKWIGNRISFKDEKSRLTIVILPEKLNWFKPLMLAWLMMWYVVGAAVVWSYFSMKLTQQELIIIMIFAAFWIYYAQRVTRSYLWMVWGKELIKIDEASLSVKRSIKGYGKAKQFLVENIKNIKLDVPESHSFMSAWEAAPWMKGNERISFEYLGKVIRFGAKLNEKDAKLLFNLVTKKIEDRLKKTKN